jgi:RNA polymerase sigma factor (TIGR02999 family)
MSTGPLSSPQAGVVGPDERFAQLYPELRRMARAKLRREATLTLLNTTSLVHESFLRLSAQGTLRTDEAPAFWAYASQVMRSVIVDHARARLTQRRGSGAEHVALDTLGLASLPAPEAQVLEVHEALAVLERAEPRLARVVEMQYFGGLTDAEIAQVLGITDRTVRRDWNKAKLLLKLALS